MSIGYTYGEDTSIEDVWARKVFNSRGEITIEVEVYTAAGFGRAAAPSGASTGKHEVPAFPEGGPDAALEAFENLVAEALIGMDADEQEAIDKKLEEVDGTGNFSRIGGALAIATSLAVAKAAASTHGIPLFQHVGGVFATKLPFPLGNVLGGGKHSRGLGPSIQEILVLPVGADNVFDAIRANIEVHRRLPKEIAKNDPSFAGGKNDEGAWTAALPSEKAVEIVYNVAKAVSKELGIEVRVGIDVAASSLWDEEKKVYRYVREGVTRDTKQQLEFIKSLVEKYELIYVEDPFHEEDFDSFAELTDVVGDRCLIVGDDLFVTNAERLRKGIELGAGNGIIIKPNQVGTLTRTAETIELAKAYGYVPIVSHRSGETEDNALAHLAVGWGAPIIKTGTVGGERMAKLNELVRIEEFLGRRAKMNIEPLKHLIK